MEALNPFVFVFLLVGVAVVEAFTISKGWESPDERKAGGSDIAGKPAHPPTHHFFFNQSPIHLSTSYKHPLISSLINHPPTHPGLRDSYIAGDLEFDPLGFAPTKDVEAFLTQRSKELNNGRLAMLAWAGTSHLPIHPPTHLPTHLLAQSSHPPTHPPTQSINPTLSNPTPSHPSQAKPSQPHPPTHPPTHPPIQAWSSRSWSPTTRSSKRD